MLKRANGVLGTIDPDDDDEQKQLAELPTTEVWNSSAKMLYWLTSTFATIPGYANIHRQLAVQVAGDTPQVLLEECIRQLYKLPAIRAIFPSNNELQQFICFALEPGSRPVLERIPQKGQEEPGPPYYVLQKIGDGGQASAFKVLVEGQVRAVKVVKDELNTMLLRRAAREQRANEAVSDVAGFVESYGGGVLTTSSYALLMEYMDGGSLKKFLNPDAINNTQHQQLGVVWFHNLCRAFAKVHPGNTLGNQPILHRDIKPDNLLINQSGEIKIADLGLAIVDSQHSITEGKNVLGTMEYMAPELLDGMDKANDRTDVYALGVTMYRFFAGKKPVDISGPREIFKHKTETVDFECIPNKELAFVIKMMLNKDQTERATMTEVANALRHLFSTNLFAKAQNTHYQQQLQVGDYVQLDPLLHAYFTAELQADTDHSMPLHRQNGTIESNGQLSVTDSLPNALSVDLHLSVTGTGSAGTDNSSFVVEQEDAAIDEELLYNPDISNKAIESIFNRLERGERIGRTRFRGIQARLLQNQTRTALIAGGILAVIGGGTHATIRTVEHNRIVNTANDTQADVYELLQRPTKITAGEWKEQIELYNLRNKYFDVVQGTERLQQITDDPEVQSRYVVEHANGQIISIEPQVDVAMRALVDECKTLCTALDGSAQALDAIANGLTRAQPQLTTVLNLPFAPTVEQLTSTLQSLLPNGYRVIVTDTTLAIEHVAERQALLNLTESYRVLGELLQKEDNPSMPAVVTHLEMLNAERSTWSYRTEELKICDTTCIAKLPEFIDVQLTANGLLVRNKSYTLEDGAQVIESRFGKYFVKNNAVEKIEHQGNIFDFSKEATVRFNISDEVYITESFFDASDFDILSSIPRPNLEKANLPRVNYYSVFLPNERAIIFTNKVQGFLFKEGVNFRYFENLNELYNSSILAKIVYLHELEITVDDAVYVKDGMDPARSIKEVRKGVLYTFQYMNFKNSSYSDGDHLYNRCYSIVFGDKTPQEVLSEDKSKDEVPPLTINN